MKTRSKPRFGPLRRATLAALTAALGASLGGEADAQYGRAPQGARYGQAPQGTPGSYDPYGGVRRVQYENLQPPTVPPGSVPSVAPGGLPATQPYALPAAENVLAAEQPTAEAAEEEAEAAEPRRYLMEAFGTEESPVQIYGWIQNSFTGNPSQPSDGLNFGVNPNYKANKWMGNQYYTVFEKALRQDDTINIGGRLDFLFGHDWEFNKMRGVFDNAFNSGQFSGIDLPQFYGEIHLPVLTEGGLDIKYGRWYTLHGYEVVPAIGRPLLSVPYMFNYGQPFTHWGLMTTWNVSENLVIYNGSPQGWDRFQNANARYGYMGGFSWTGLEGKMNLTFIYSHNSNVYPRFINQVNSAGALPVLQANSNFTDRSLNLWTTVLSYQWTEKLTQVLETDQAMESGIPLQANSNGTTTVTKQGNATWYSFGNWFLYQATEKLTGVWRSEVFWDTDGARTGAADRYYEMTLGAIYKPCPNIWVRPEARYDWAQFGTPYNGGVSGSQFTLGFDVIFLY